MIAPKVRHPLPLSHWIADASLISVRFPTPLKVTRIFYASASFRHRLRGVEVVWGRQGVFLKVAYRAAFRSALPRTNTHTQTLIAKRELCWECAQPDKHVPFQPVCT